MTDSALMSAMRAFSGTPLGKWRRWGRWIEPKDTDSLQAHIHWYSGAGYRGRPPEVQGFVVESQTETSAFLVNPKWRGFSQMWFMFWWILTWPFAGFVTWPFAAVGLIIYPLYYYFIKKERTEIVYLYVEGVKVKRLSEVPEGVSHPAGTGYGVEPEPTPPEPEPTQPDALDQLERLARLHRSGILTDQEFADKKAQLLERL